jgi:hypothetical protein
MTEAETLTLTCPRCATPMRARATDAGRKVRCPHPECRLLVLVPFPLEDDEPDEPVLLPEDPADPQQVPLAVAPVPPREAPAPAPKPRRPTRHHEEDAVRPRTAILPWALTAFALLLAAGAVMGWVVSATRDDPDSAAALEAKNRDLRAENQKLRGQLDAAKPPAPRPLSASAREITYSGFLNLVDAGQLKSVTLFGDDRAEGEVRDPNHELAQEQRLGTRGLFVVYLPPSGDAGALVQRIERADQRYRAEQERANRPVSEPVSVTRRDDPGKKIETPGRPPEGRDAFVGKWSVTDAQIERSGAELTVEFRADGTCALNSRIRGITQELSGTWRWDGRLHLSLSGSAAAVAWNGPDEFVATADNVPSTFRRKR